MPEKRPVYWIYALLLADVVLFFHKPLFSSQHLFQWDFRGVQLPPITFLADQLRPAPPADAKLVAGLLSDLESKTFAVRQAAVRKLADLGDAAEPAIRKALEGLPPLEVRHQLELLLRQRGKEVIRQLRAIEALEHIDSGEARQVLEALVKVAPDPRTASAARAALGRLGQ